MLWVMKITVFCSRCHNSSSYSWSNWRVWESTEPNGSSMSKIMGFTANASQTCTLLHAPGEFMGIVVRKILQPHALQITTGDTGAFLFGDSAQLQTELHVGEHRAPRQ